MEARQKELTVCDIIGEWGLYQWSVTLFAMLYSALAGIVVVVGPLWTPDMVHLCQVSAGNGGGSDLLNGSSSLELRFADQPHQCFATTAEDGTAEQLAALVTDQQAAAANLTAAECSSFVYDSQKYGKILTNSVSKQHCGDQVRLSIRRLIDLGGGYLSDVSSTTTTTTTTTRREIGRHEQQVRAQQQWTMRPVAASEWRTGEQLG